MKWLIATTLATSLLALPMTALAEGKGHGNGHGNGNSAHQSNRGHGNGHGNNGHRANNGHKPAKTTAGRADHNYSRLRFATPDTDIAALDDIQLGRLVNCPPGLAKKNPPCVPPGLAAKGVTFSEWTGYDRDALRDLLDDRWTTYDPAVVSPLDPGLTQAQIRDIFALPPAPDGQRYAVIDGRPVLLDAADYDRLLTLNSLAARPTIPGGSIISPAAALTQEELQTLYGLPPLPAGQNYAVLDNQIITLADPAYDLLQLIRILGAV